MKLPKGLWSLFLVMASPNLSWEQHQMNATQSMDHNSFVISISIMYKLKQLKLFLTKIRPTIFFTEVPLSGQKVWRKGMETHFLIEGKYFYQKANIFYTKNSTIPTQPTRITLSNCMDWQFLPFSNQRWLLPLVLIDTHGRHLSFHLFWIGNDTSFHSFGLIIPFSWQSPQEPLSIYLDLFSLNDFNVTAQITLLVPSKIPNISLCCFTSIFYLAFYVYPHSVRTFLMHFAVRN